ncbi:MAG TPA: porin family protein [Bacteroidales bacterium]|nr:porin family protein [Bacteroidales bacterium]
MKKNSGILSKLKFSFLLLFLPIVAIAQTNRQDIGFGLHFDPVISWFGSDRNVTRNDGARPGFNLGLTFNKYFADNYAFSTGINIIAAGGRLSNVDTTVLEFTNFNSTVLPGNSVIYKIQYLSIPLGLKFRTNQIGYLTYFANVGIDPKITIGGKADIPSLDITGEKAVEELKFFNMSWHITAGIEYSLGGNTALVAGLNFENNFLDITKENNIQPEDKITHKLLSFRLGINF